MLKKFFANEEQLQQWAKKVAQQCSAPVIMFLKGELGAGKTTFARAFIQSLGVKERVKSPTYPIVESYSIEKMKIFHFDLYRIHLANELDELGFDDYFKEAAIVLIEWPERGEGVVPSADIEITFAIKDEGREVAIKVNTERGQAVILGNA